MRQPSTFRLAVLLNLFALLLAAPGRAGAQAPPWVQATIGNTSQFEGYSSITATATDASGNIFVTGYVIGKVVFGNLSLTCSGDDLFVGKYVPATNTWAWLVKGGGTSSDSGLGIAVSGSSIYVTGYITNDNANLFNVAFGGSNPATGSVTQYGTSPNAYYHDLVVVKYTDLGTSVVANWSQVGGGTDEDAGNAIAVSGSNVYVTGSITNSRTNASAVVFGGSGTTAGTVAQYGIYANPTPDLVVAKYTDNGSSATLGWTQVGGNSFKDEGTGIAVAGNKVYVTGHALWGAVFGGSGSVAGTVQQNGIGATDDLMLVKYIDNGASATVAWTQAAGGTGADYGRAVAVSGTSVYVTGSITNNLANITQVVFGASGTTAGTHVQVGAASVPSTDLVVAKYTDNGSTATLVWTQVAGGTGSDTGQSLALSGSSLYVAGYVTNTTANANSVLFGGSGTTPGTQVQAGASATASPDLVVAKYVDAGATATVAWTQAGGGTADDNGNSVVVSGGSVWVGSLFTSPRVVLGTASGSPWLGTNENGAALVSLTDLGTSGSWQTLVATTNGGACYTTATATDASGNVFVTGYFRGQVLFGSTALSSAGNYDLFVAKYVPATGTWAWAQSGGGTYHDYGLSIAVRGSSVYVTGQVFTNAANANAVAFGSTGSTLGTVSQSGTGSTVNFNLVVVKYTDLGTSATVAWTQTAGGTGNDAGYGIAVSGSSVYVTGYASNNTANANAVVFGGSGTTPGTVAQAGASATTSADLVVAKYTDNGPTATLAWTQVGGGTSQDQGTGIAVSGSNVYVTGYLTNSRTNANSVLLGGSGTTAGTVPQYGASSSADRDLVVLKYQDNGASAALGWAQVGGGTSQDQGTGIAVSGTSVYVTGTLYNNRVNSNAVIFGGSGATAGTAAQYGATATTSQDVVVAKYTDNGPTATLGWTQVGGGTGADNGQAIAVRGTHVYVAGSLTNNIANNYGALFGGSGTTPGTVAVNGAGSSTSRNADFLVAGYTDTGSAAALDWAQAAGGDAYDAASGLALSGTALYAAGIIGTPSTFGSFLLTSNSSYSSVCFLGALDLSNVLATSTPSPAALSLTLYPNPASSGAHLSGAPALISGQVVDALGRTVATFRTDATGAALLPAALAPGVYAVRVGAAVGRLVVQ